MSTQNNLIIVTDSVKRGGTQIIFWMKYFCSTFSGLPLTWVQHNYFIFQISPQKEK
jgi:hypothetical protein